MADLPVQVEVAGALRAELVAWLEGDLRWQVVSGGGPLSAQVLITDDPSRAAGAVVIVDHGIRGDQRAAVVSRALRAGALDVVVWPDERDRVVGAVREGPVASGSWPPAQGQRAWPGSQPRVLRVAGVCGGAGTSTVALALGAWAAWTGARAIVAGDDDLLELCDLAPWRGPGSAEIATLAPQDIGREVGALSRRVPGVARLRVLGGGDPLAVPFDRDWPADVLVVDDRCRLRTADVVVGIAHRRLRRCAAYRQVMLVRSSPRVGRREIVRLLGGSPAGWIEEDQRVQRAGLAGRVPSALPGRWLRSVASAVARRAGGGGP